MTRDTKQSGGALAALRPQVEELLKSSLKDRRLSKAERQQLQDLVAEAGLGPQDLAQLRHRAVQVAKGAVEDGSARLMGWLGEVLEALTDTGSGPGSEAHFSPGDDCVQRVCELLDDATRKVDICVFTITDDRVSDRIQQAHRRGVSVRIISDDEKSHDRGSDVDRLQRAGIPVRVDSSPAHMHHKFALFDGRQLLTGSYNWTRSASRDNQENIVITADPTLVDAFTATFEDLWRRFG